MKRKLVFYSSVITVISYLLFTFIAFMVFPNTYSPTQNWLSDLGSSRLNPRGAVVYNLGIVLTGLAVLICFLGIDEWRIAGHKKQNAMLFLTRLFGCLGALAMIMSALFPITLFDAHSFWSSSLYILLGTAFGFSVAALRYYPRFPRWLLFLGALIAIEDMIWGWVLNTYPMEWLTVALFLSYILLLGIETKRKPDYPK
jgi:hypothetical membrane protein